MEPRKENIRAARWKKRLFDAEDREERREERREEVMMAMTDVEKKIHFCPYSDLFRTYFD